MSQPSVPIESLIGKRFGMLLVGGVVLKKRSVRNLRVLQCKCDCGNKSLVLKGDLMRGSTTSCGCKRGLAKYANRTHGLSRTPEYRIWKAMCRRCFGKKTKSFKHYGGRGITVSAEWRGPSGFRKFIAHVGARPSPKHQIERINNEKHYEPGNVRWATRIEQMRNFRRNRLITWNGRTLCLAEWAEIIGIDQDTLGGRIKRGLDLERAMTTPARDRGRPGKAPRHRLVTINGETHPIGEWIKRLGRSRTHVYRRIRSGWTPERALSEAPRQWRKNRVHG